jgi:hypothetical protein
VTPDSFSFTLTVPADARLMGVVQHLCAHAVTYAGGGEALRDPFCARVAEVARRAVAAGRNSSCALEFHCEDGELRVTIDGETVSQPLPA